MLALRAGAGPGKGHLLDFVDQLPDLALPLDAQRAVGDGEPGAGGEEAGKDDPPRPRRDVDEAAGARRDMRARAELGDVDRALAVDLEEGQQRAIEAAALEVGELMGRGHHRLGVGGAAELEVEQRHAADGALFDHPGDRAVAAFLDEDARHVGRNAKADVDRVALAQLLGDAAGDDLGNVELRQFERRQRPEDFAGNRRIVDGLRRLQLIGRDHDRVDEDARHQHLLRLQRARLGEPFDLGDHHAAVVAHAQRLIERAEIAALVLVGEIAALVRGGRANDRDVGNDRRKEQPFVVGEGDAAHNRGGGRLGVHRAALAAGIDEGVEADLGQHARPPGRRVAMHVEQDAGGDVVGGNLVVGDHRPDFGRLAFRRAGGIGAGENPRQAAGLGEMVDAGDPPHVAGGDRMKGGQIARMAVVVEAPADRRQHRVGAAEPRGGGHGDDRPVRDQAGCFVGGHHARKGHRYNPGSTAVSRREPADSSAASAIAIERTPSSPEADGAPSPLTAAWKARTERS